MERTHSAQVAWHSYHTWRPASLKPSPEGNTLGSQKPIPSCCTSTTDSKGTPLIHRRPRLAWSHLNVQTDNLLFLFDFQYAHCTITQGMLGTLLLRYPLLN